MNLPDDRIIKFIRKHHILTLATSKENKPYAATCFYVYLQNQNLFVFTSDKTTKHIADAEQQPVVSGAIALETNIIGKIQGIQFTGLIRELRGDELMTAKRAYIKKFPVAMLMKTTLWGIEPDYIKLTDNRLCFGKKMIWRYDR